MNKKRKLLLIDDSPSSREVAADDLRAAGYTVATHDSAFGAVAAIIQNDPDLVLLDVQMPDIDGPSLAKMLKATPALHRKPLVLFSNLPSRELAKLAAECGADAYLERSNDPAALVREMGRIVEQTASVAKTSKRRKRQEAEQPRGEGLDLLREASLRRMEHLTEDWVDAVSRVSAALRQKLPRKEIERFQAAAASIEEKLKAATQEVLDLQQDDGAG